MEEPPKFKAGNLYPIDNDTMNNIEVICDGEESADNWSWMKLLNENIKFRKLSENSQKRIHLRLNEELRS